jgi:cytoskeletal protein CcmA (bactofilin family)
MKKNGNFSQAFAELVGGKTGGSETEDGENSGSDVAEPNPATRFPEVRHVEESLHEAVITADMVIKGTVNSSSNISISGTILGDVGSEGDIVVMGKVEGNVTAHSLVVQAGTITGDITSSGAVIIVENSTVNGNIKAERIEVNGKVTGNLDSAAKVTLNSHAAVDGNVAAAGLAMMEGAELKGNVNVHKTE